MLRVEAIDVALNNSRAPQVSKPKTLPNNMTDLIRIAAEHQETVDRCVQTKKLKPEQLIEAAQFYLQSMILDSGDDAYKTLGLRPGASAADIKDHKRMLLKWLHPDLNKNRWQSALFNKVQTAATRLQAIETVEVPAAFIVAQPPEKLSSRKSPRPKSSRGFQRKTGRRVLLMRSIGIPALAIAVGAIMIYLLQTQFYNGYVVNNWLHQVLPWYTR